jgi:hypothetical protein
MKETNYIHKSFPIPQRTKSGENIFVSFTQYQTYSSCPKKWKTSYIDKIKIYEPSIHSLFGEAVHELLQKYILYLYTKKIKDADAIDFEQELMDSLREKYQQELLKNNTHFSSQEVLANFYTQGLEILQYVRKKRKLYFNPKKEELIGIEMPLLLPVDEVHNHVYLMGFVDFAIRNKLDGKIKIVDIKTSTKGWNEYDKKSSKINQILIYKKYFAEQYNVNVEDIDVEYFIVRRTINMEIAFPTKRVQLYTPSSGKVSLKRSHTEWLNFINDCFTNDSQYNSNGEFPAKPGTNNYNCKFCPYNSTCDKK